MGMKHSEAATVTETETVGEGNRREGQRAMGTGPAGYCTVQVTTSQTSVREWEPPWHTPKACGPRHSPYWSTTAAKFLACLPMTGPPRLTCTPECGRAWYLRGEGW